MPKCKECDKTKQESEMGDKPGFCKSCCDTYRCPVCEKTMVPSKSMPNACTSVTCQGQDCGKKFSVHKACSSKSPLLCGACVLLRGKPKLVIPLLSSFFGTAPDPGIELIGVGTTCSSCGATYDQARKFCEKHKLSGDSKNAHCIIPQTIIKRTGQIIIDFYNIVCQIPCVAEARKSKQRICVKLVGSPFVLDRKVFLSKQGDIDGVMSKLLHKELTIEVIASDGLEKEWHYFEKVEPMHGSLEPVSRALQIIGQSNLNQFHVGKQCAVCEFVQGDLPLLERLWIALAFEDAAKYLEKLTPQVEKVAKLLAQREQEEEAEFHVFARRVARSNTSQRAPLLEPNMIEALHRRIDKSLALVDELRRETVLMPIQMIENPLVRRWVEQLVGRTFQHGHMTLLLRAYVGKHLRKGMDKHQGPLAFMMSWLDSDLLQEVYKRIAESHRGSQALEVAWQLWPVFVQYYTASLLARCQQKLTADEINRVVELFFTYGGELVSGDVGLSWKKAI